MLKAEKYFQEYIELFQKVVDKANAEGLEILKIQEGDHYCGKAYLMYIKKELVPESKLNKEQLKYIENNLIRRLYKHLSEEELPFDVKNTSILFISSYKENEIIERMKEGNKFYTGIMDGRISITSYKGPEDFQDEMPRAKNLQELLEKGYTYLWSEFPDLD